MEFIAEFAARNKREVDGISVEALLAMQAYDWPGNIRELRNMIERAIALCLGREIQLEDLPEQFQRIGYETATRDALARPLSIPRPHAPFRCPPSPAPRMTPSGFGSPMPCGGTRTTASAPPRSWASAG